MKQIKYIVSFFIASFLLLGCVPNNPLIEDFLGDQIAFSYKVVGDYEIDYLVGSTISFANTSELTGEAIWNFGDGTPEVKDPNPTHIFQVAGTYNVTLTIQGQGKTTKTIMISDIFPTIILDPIPGGGICEVNKVPVHFTVTLPNPQNLPVESTWIFPVGTVNENGVEILTSNDQDPGKLKFKNVGSQRIVLKTKLGGRPLEEGMFNVPVGYSSPAKTIYYAVKGGNIMALKLVSNMPADVGNFPFDLGIKSGQHPFNILFQDSSLYVLDAGKQFTFINDVDGVMGDGKISVVAYDGSKSETLLSNNNKAAFDDPFYGYVDDQYLYFSDRNTGVRRVLRSERNLVLDATNPKYAFVVQNQTLNYYNVGYQYGAMNACMTKLKDGTWWWSKTFNGNGIFRFKDSDILPKPTTGGGTPGDPYEVMASGFFIKSFVVDEARSMVYYVIREKGFYKASIEDFKKINATNLGTKITDLISDSEGSAGEYVDVCQMALDPDDGSVYFGYRRDPSSTIISGLKRYDPATNKLISLVDNVEIYGVAINHRKSKLF